MNLLSTLLFKTGLSTIPHNLPLQIDNTNLYHIIILIFKSCGRVWSPSWKRNIFRRLRILIYPFLGCLKFASKLNSKMNTPESCSFWVTDTGNISFSTQIHCFHQVLASWLSSISLLELKIFLLTTPPCHTSKVASWHVDCRYDLHFWCYLGKILSKSWKTCKKLWFEQ